MSSTPRRYSLEIDILPSTRRSIYFSTIRLTIALTISEFVDSSMLTTIHQQNTAESFRSVYFPLFLAADDLQAAHSPPLCILQSTDFGFPVPPLIPDSVLRHIFIRATSEFIDSWTLRTNH
jgi:hypothetical protein